GGKVRFKDKQFSIRSFELLEYGGGQTLTLDSNGFADDFNAIGFMDGSFNTPLGHYISLSALDGFINANTGDFEADTDKANEEITSQQYRASEDVYAAYAMGKINFKKLMLLGGLRYEATRFSYNSGI